MRNILSEKLSEAQSQREGFSFTHPLALALGHVSGSSYRERVEEKSSPNEEVRAGRYQTTQTRRHINQVRQVLWLQPAKHAGDIQGRWTKQKPRDSSSDEKQLEEGHSREKRHPQQFLWILFQGGSHSVTNTLLRAITELGRMEAVEERSYLEQDLYFTASFICYLHTLTQDPKSDQQGQSAPQQGDLYPLEGRYSGVTSGCPGCEDRDNFKRLHRQTSCVLLRRAASSSRRLLRSNKGKK